jgi:hypothetical protein
MEAPCARCGKLHDITALEPSLMRPDAYLAVPEAERGERTKASNDFCTVVGQGGGSRWFVRALMPFPVEGVDRPCCWGVWCEVSAQDFATIQLLWNDPQQCAHPPFAATLANDLHGYPPTAGLAGAVRFVDPDDIPFFELAADVTHPIADEMRAGVTPARVLEWLAPYLHGASEDSGWPFDQAPDVAAITTRQVIEGGLPVLRVIHYSEDHSWAFLCGTTGDTADGRVISMVEALRRDPTLGEIADLPPGWVASRDHVGGDWQRVCDPEM